MGGRADKADIENDNLAPYACVCRQKAVPLQAEHNPLNTKDMIIGTFHKSTLVVDEQHTAQALGSGDMPVWATPSMLALMENAAMAAVQEQLEEGQTTVGAHIESSHLRPSPVGASVYATAELTAAEGRKLHFRVQAYQHTPEGDLLLGEGTHLRFIVDKKKFLNKIS